MSYWYSGSSRRQRRILSFFTFDDALRPNMKGTACWSVIILNLLPDRFDDGRGFLLDGMILLSF